MVTVDKERWRARLVELIEHLKISQAEFAAETGIDPTYVSRMLYEPGKAGRKNVGPTQAAKISSAYMLPPGWFDMEPGSAMPGAATTYESMVVRSIAPPAYQASTWPFRLVTQARLDALRHALGPNVGPLAVEDIDKYLDVAVSKWERDVLTRKRS